MSRLSPILSFYIARRFLAGFAVVLLAVGGIILLLDVVELLRRASGHPEISFGMVLQLAVLQLPQAIQKVVPFCVLFGGMYAFWRLTRTSELVVVRASGVSVWQFLFPAMVTALLIGAFVVGIFNPLGATMQLRYEQLDAQLFDGKASLLSLSSNGLWLRQANDGGQAVIHAQRMKPGNRELENVTVFLYSAQHKFSGRLDAPEVRLEKGAWVLSDVLVTAPDQPSHHQDRYVLPTEWTPAKIQDSFSSPETLSFWNLPGFIKLLDNAGFTATRYRVYWYSMLAAPLMLAVMVLIAASFSLRMSRRGGVAALIGTGVVFSFFIFFLSDVLFALGLSATIPPLLAAWTPAAVTGLIGVSILLHIEDG